MLGVQTPKKARQAYEFIVQSSLIKTSKLPGGSGNVRSCENHDNDDTGKNHDDNGDEEYDHENDNYDASQSPTVAGICLLESRSR